MGFFNLSDNVNAISIIGAIAILAGCVYVAMNLFKRIQNSKANGDLAEDEWDGIKEFVNDIPQPALLFWLGCIIWGFWYFFIGYPLNSYSSVGEYNEEVQVHNKKFAEKWKNADKDTLISMGEGIYLVNCSQCHGIIADGEDGKAANLLNWAKEEGIATTVLKGSDGMGKMAGAMPPMSADPEEAKAIAAYVFTKFVGGKTKYPDLVKVGESKYAACAGCHGADGKGMNGLAADLTEYGKVKFLKEVLTHGKKGNIGTMPIFTQLSDVQIKALDYYILTLHD